MKSFSTRVRLLTALIVTLASSAGLYGCGDAGIANQPVQARLEAILLEPDALERARRLTDLFDGLDPSELRTVRISYRTFSGYVGGMEAALFASWWGEFDPEGLLDAIQKGAFGTHGEAALETVIRSWARRDFHAAQEHLFQEGAVYPKETALLALIRGWAESGDPGVWDFVEDFPKGVARQQALEVLTDHMVLSQGIEATTRFVEALPDDGASRFKLQAYRRLAAALVLKDPGFAAAWAERNLDSEFGEGVLRHVVGRWAHFDSQATCEWLAGMPPSAAQEEAIELAYSMWLRRADGEAMAWAVAQPETDALEPVRALYAARVSRQDGPAAAAVLDSIKDSKRWTWTAANLARGWLETDRSAALAWMEQAELPEELRQTILAPPKPRRARGKRAAAQAAAPTP